MKKEIKCCLYPLQAQIPFLPDPVDRQPLLHESDTDDEDYVDCEVSILPFSALKITLWSSNVQIHPLNISYVFHFICFSRLVIQLLLSLTLKLQNRLMKLNQMMMSTIVPSMD